MTLESEVSGQSMASMNLKSTCDFANRLQSALMGRYPETQGKNREASPWLNGEAEELYNHYYSRLAGVAATRYRWKGLPDNIDPMRLEFQLVLGGGLAAFSHVRPRAALGAGELEAAKGRFTVTKCTYGAADLDDLFNPAGYTTYGPNGSGGTTFHTNKPLKEWRGVPIWGDALRMDYDGATIRLFAMRLAKASLVVDTNMLATTRGIVLATTQDKLVTVQTMLDSTLSGLPTVVADPELLESIKALDLGVHPDTVERSHVVAMRIWNEALTALGVQSGAQEKDERLTDDEVQAIRGAVEAVRLRTLMPRLLAAKQINRRYYEGKEIVTVVDQKLEMEPGE
jgi:hypothetical protein